MVLRAETREELEDALLRLPVIYRTAVVLHDAEGWTVRAIAEMHEIGLPAAKQRLRRGRMMLVTELARGQNAARRCAACRCAAGTPAARCPTTSTAISNPGDAELVEPHLEACPTCPPLYASLVGATAALAGLQDPDSVVPDLLADRIEGLLAGRA